MPPAPRQVISAALLLTLAALDASTVGAQPSRADSLLVAGASVRFRTSETDRRGTEAVIVARRADTLDLKITTRWGANPTVREASMNWRNVYGLEARGASAADGPFEGAAVGFVLGAAIGAVLAKPSRGSLDFSLSTNPELLGLAGGLLGGLVGFFIDESIDNRPWVAINP